MGIRRWGDASREWILEKKDDGHFVFFTDHERVVAELDGVIEQRDALDVACLDMEREITRLRAELAAKSKDAERYQWLRQLDNAFDFRKLPRTWSAAHTPEQLDDTIDEAMGEGNGR